MVTHAIIIAAGEASRWGDYLGVPKHFAPVNDEPIIERTVRLLRGFKDTEIFVVAPDDKRYGIEGSNLFTPNKNYSNYDADKFLNSRKLWNTNGRTIVFYGDVYFTEDAINRIMAYEEKSWRLFGRAFKSELTGTPFGECFAQSFYNENIPEHDAALRRIVNLYARGIISRCGGWEHYRAILGLPDSLMEKHLVGDKFENIDDWTDDFDWPSDYDRFVERFSK